MISLSHDAFTLDDVHLLQFLRAHKFSVDQAFQKFENFYLSRKRYPQFFEFTEEQITDLGNLFDAGFCFPLEGRDKLGRVVLFTWNQKLNTSPYTVYDAVRLVMWISMVLIEDENNQIAGGISINDCTELSIKKSLNLFDAIEIADFGLKCVAMRLKGFYFVNLPKFMQFILEKTKSVMSEKLKNRFAFLKSVEDLGEFIDLSLLPKEHGGTIPEAEMIENFKKIWRERNGKVREIIDFKLDWRKVPLDRLNRHKDSESFGTFRKLEID